MRVFKSAFCVYFCCILLLLLQSCNLDNQSSERADVIADFAKIQWLLDNDKSKESKLYFDSIVKANIYKSDFYKLNYYQYSYNFASLNNLSDRDRVAYYDSMTVVDDLSTTNYPVEYLPILTKRADYYLKYKDFNRATKSLFIVKLIATNNKNQQGLFSYYSIIGNALYRQKQYYEAANSYSKAFKYAHFINIDERQNTLRTIYGQANNTAISYMWAGELDSAELYFQYGQQCLDTIPRESEVDYHFYHYAQGVFYSNYATLEDLKGNSDKSIEYNLMSLDYTVDSCKEESTTITTLVALGNEYLKTNQFDKTVSVINTIDSLNKDSLYKSYMSSIYELKWKYYSALSDTPKAYANYYQYKKAQEDNNKIRISLADIDFDREIAKHQDIYEYEGLKERAQYQKQILLITILLLLVFILSYFAIKNRNKMLKKLYAELALKNEQLTLSIQILEESQEENRRLLRVVVHDLRTPIGGFIGLTELLLEKDYLESEDLEFIQLINKTSKEAIGFINDLLYINNNESKLSFSDVDLNRILDQTIMLIGSKAHEKNIKFNIDNQAVKAKVNRDNISRIMSNLISNAIKFSPENSQIDLTLKKEGSHVKLMVKDYGIGMPKSMHAKVFQLDETKKRQGTQGEESFGLGLVITKQLVDANNGKIWFESKEHQGTTFYIEFHAL